MGDDMVNTSIVIFADDVVKLQHTAPLLFFLMGNLGLTIGNERVSVSLHNQLTKRYIDVQAMAHMSWQIGEVDRDEGRDTVLVPMPGIYRRCFCLALSSVYNNGMQ